MSNKTKSRSTAHGQQSPPGDFTAREKARLESEQAEEQAEAQRRMATVSARNAEVNEKGIHDPKSGEMLEGPEVLDDEDEDEDVGDVNELVTKPGAPPVERRPAVELLDDEEEPQEEFRIGRVNMDLDSVTYGHGNEYSFERGKRYRMPRDLYDHLDSKGYIFH